MTDRWNDCRGGGCNVNILGLCNRSGVVQQLYTMNCLRALIRSWTGYLKKERMVNHIAQRRYKTHLIANQSRGGN